MYSVMIMFHCSMESVSTLTVWLVVV